MKNNLLKFKLKKMYKKFKDHMNYNYSKMNSIILLNLL